MLCILQVLDLHLGPEIGGPDSYSQLHSFPPSRCNIANQAMTVYFHAFQYIIHYSSNLLTSQTYSSHIFNEAINTQIGVNNKRHL